MEDNPKLNLLKGSGKQKSLDWEKYVILGLDVSKRNVFFLSVKRKQVHCDKRWAWTLVAGVHWMILVLYAVKGVNAISVNLKRWKLEMRPV